MMPDRLITTEKSDRMLIQELELRNIKSYQEAEIQFRPGVNGIVGANGAGKSTILEAIGYTLFNSTPTRNIKEYFIREGTRHGEIRVRVLNDRDERTYDIVRHLGGNRAYYVHSHDEDYRICEGNADVQAFLRQEMGGGLTIDLSTLFEQAVGVAQGQFHTPFLETRQNRINRFSPMLDIQKFRDASDSLLKTGHYIRELVNETANDIGRLETRLMPRADLEKERTVLEAGTRERQALLLDIQARIEAHSSQLEHWDAQVSEIRQGESQLAVQQQELAKITARLQIAEEHLRQAREADQYVRSHTPAHAAYVQAQQELDLLEEQRQEADRLHVALAHLCAQQEEADRLLAQTRQALDEMDGVRRQHDMHRTAFERAQNLQQELAHTSLPPDTIGTLASRVREAERHIEELAWDGPRIEQELQRKSDLLDRSAQALAQATQYREEAHGIRTDRAGVQTRLEALQEQERALQKTAPIAHEHQDGLHCPVCEQALSPDQYDAIMNRNRQEADRYRNSLQVLNAALKDCEQNRQQQERESSQLQEEAQDLCNETDLIKVQADMTRWEETLWAAGKEQNKARDILNRQGILQQELDALSPAVEVYEECRSQLRNEPRLQEELDRLEPRKRELETEVAAVQAQLQPFAHLKDRIEQARTRLRQHTAGYMQVERHQAMAQQCTQYETDFLEVQKQVQELDGQVQAGASSLAAQRQAYDHVQHQKVQAEQAALGAEQVRITTELQYMDRTLGECRKKLAALEKVQDRLDAARIEHEARTRRAGQLDQIRIFLREVQPLIAQALVQRISGEAREFFHALTEDYTRHLHWTEDFGIVLQVDNRQRNFRQLSGGEQMAASLAVIMAVLRSLTNVRFAFFDEPTVNLDRERRARLAQRIRDIKGFSQFFLISHDDTFEDSLEHVVRVYRDSNGSHVAIAHEDPA